MWHQLYVVLLGQVQPRRAPYQPANAATRASLQSVLQNFPQYGPSGGTMMLRSAAFQAPNQLDKAENEVKRLMEGVTGRLMKISD